MADPDNIRKNQGVDTSWLAAYVVEMCRHRGWSMHWTHRGAYLHLEASELIEAIRGKHGDPLKEAADVLLVLMSITEYRGIPWREVERQAKAKCEEMMTRPRYDGEEHDGSQLG
jgi:NTP pyrophosphatase (non-canonical NTP hydrolase)